MARVSMGTAAALPERRALPRLSDLAYVLKASRPGMWLTAVWFYLLPLGGRDLIHSLDFWVGLFYITFPLGLFLSGWNDLTDAALDRSNPRKDSYLFGACGNSAQLAALPFLIVLAQAPFLVLFTLWLGPRMLWWLLAWSVACALYNHAPFTWKARTPFDLLVQPTFLLVFLFSSWVNHAPQLPWPAFVFGALFAMHGHLMQEIMDLEPDRAAGRRTTAVVLGAVPSKLLVSLLLVGEAAVLGIYFRDLALGGFLGMCALGAAADAALLWRDRPYTPPQMRCFMVAWNLLVLFSIPWVWRAASLTRMAG